VTSILRPDEAEQMVDLAEELNFDFIDVEYAMGVDSTSSDVEDMRRYLEDTLTLVELTDELELDLDELDKNRPVIEYDDDDDDEEEDDEN